MNVTALTSTGNSSKFHVVTKQGDFDVALSHTLRVHKWKLSDPAAELLVAKELSEAIVSRHDPQLPFKTVYIFGEHNTDSTYAMTAQKIRKLGFRATKI